MSTSAVGGDRDIAFMPASPPHHPVLTTYALFFIAAAHSCG